MTKQHEEPQKPNHFDQVAKDWDMNKMHAERTDAIAAILLKKGLIKPGMTGLEFGAGTGLLSIALKDLFKEIVLLDSSAEMVKITAQKIADRGIQNLYPHFFDLEKATYDQRTFDMVFSQMVLHHVADIGKILTAFHQLLKPEGILVIADLYSEDGSFHDQEFKGHYGFDPEVLAEQLKQSGFNHIEHQPCFTLNKPAEDGTLRAYPVFLLSAVKEKE